MEDKGFPIILVVIGAVVLALFLIPAWGEGVFDSWISWIGRLQVVSSGPGRAGLLFEDQPIASAAGVADGFMRRRVAGEKASEVIEATGSLVLSAGEGALLAAEADRTRALTPQELRALEIENGLRAQELRKAQRDNLLEDLILYGSFVALFLIFGVVAYTLWRIYRSARRFRSLV